jgi:hypothetical protein
MKIRAATKKKETPHAAILATFEIEPSFPILGIPQDGLTPTGALVELAEMGSKTVEASR